MFINKADATEYNPGNISAKGNSKVIRVDQICDIDSENGNVYSTVPIKYALGDL